MPKALQQRDAEGANDSPIWGIDASRVSLDTVQKGPRISAWAEQSEASVNHQSAVLVQESWKRIDAIGPVVVGIFHNNLLRVDPRFASLFTGGVDKRDIMIGQSFGAAVQAIANESSASGCIHRLERIYSCGGVESANFDTFGSVLIQTLQQVMGDDFSQKHHDAWRDVFATLSSKSKPTLH
ncbi:globin domain-containing protein [Rhodoferax aquaticus]|uniref:Globin domain-containing protein n=1 Tax=Rhodoferax aquaticus TaxID=2527691 RepID=A0A515EU82_9BURK|nr:globin domain-containing protein [Rhodoferax aquaticus]QDL56235.1 hypothetical protein EXZ61_19870 [Rhodoferax aquaticus]